MNKEEQRQATLAGIRRDVANDLEWVPGTFIQFKRVRDREKGVTQFWWVREGSTQEGNTIGAVKWFGRWRKYGYFPWNDTVYEETCQREIAEFCEALTKRHRAKKKERS